MRVLVTGAGGFLGGAVARMLLARGDQVIAVQRGAAAELVALGAELLQGDLADPATAARAAKGCDGVIHVAAKAGHWGSYASYFSANVLATRNILAACEQHGIARLVYTSTPSVVHAGGDLAGVNESAAVATHFHAHYPATKAIAEREVLQANSATLSTCALRPHLIWGPGDNHLRKSGQAAFCRRRAKFTGHHLYRQRRACASSGTGSPCAKCRLRRQSVFFEQRRTVAGKRNSQSSDRVRRFAALQ